MSENSTQSQKIENNPLPLPFPLQPLDQFSKGHLEALLQKQNSLQTSFQPPNFKPSSPNILGFSTPSIYFLLIRVDLVSAAPTPIEPKFLQGSLWANQHRE